MNTKIDKIKYFLIAAFFFMQGFIPLNAEPLGINIDADTILLPRGSADQKVTITASGSTETPDDECEKCNEGQPEFQAPSINSDLTEWTFNHDIGSQKDNKIEVTVTSSTGTGVFSFQAISLSETYECSDPFTGGPFTETNTEASEVVELIVADASISSVEPEVICNSPAYFTLDQGYQFAEVSIDIYPGEKEEQLRSDAQIVIKSASPNTSNKGSLIHTYFYQDGFPVGYQAKSETSSMKCPSTEELQDQTVTLALEFMGTEIEEAEITVRSVFNYLILNESDYNLAIEAISAKYGVNQSATYNPSLPDYGSTQVVTGSVQIGPSGIADENVLASPLIHEKKHVEQGAIMRGFAAQGMIFWDNKGGYATPASGYNSFERNCISIWANAEAVAYYAEAANFSHTCLGSLEASNVTFSISYYSEIDSYITNP